MAGRNITILARNFASSAQQQLVKPPIQLFGVEGRYACALYSAASKLKQLDVVEKDLIKFQGILKTDLRLQEFIRNPILKRSLKVTAVKEIAAKVPLSVPSTNLLALLAENGRLKAVNTIINSFKTIMAAHRGEVVCEVTTAKPLDEVQKKDLETALHAFFKKGETLLLTAKVDPAILGGMIISIGDKYVDMSIASKIKKYSGLISQAV